MRSTTRLTRCVALLLTVSAIVALAVGMAGCGAKADEKKDVADAEGLFHFKVPSEWQYLIDSGIITVYAAEELPAEGEPAEALSVLVLVSTTTTTTPVPDALEAFIAEWSMTRGWTGATLSEPAPATVGGRDATRVDVTATDGAGRPFKGAYIWTRTAGGEVLVMAITPPGIWDRSQEDIDGLLQDWYWHSPAEQSAEPSATP